MRPHTLHTNGHDISRPSAYVRSLAEVLERVDTDVVDAMTDVLLRARAEGRTVFIVGNGGSASTPVTWLPISAR